MLVVVVVVEEFGVSGEGGGMVGGCWRFEGLQIGLELLVTNFKFIVLAGSNDDATATFEKSCSGLWLDVSSFETFIWPQAFGL